jgi:diaminopimelate epimerase
MESIKEVLKRVAVAYPSGNTTAIVFDQLQDKNLQDLNNRIIETWQTQYPDQPQIEQCCFVTAPVSPEATARIEMFGGEFCGNATRSAIWLLTEGNDYEGLIEASGTDRLLNFRVKNGKVAVEIPPPATDELTKIVAEGTLVQLEGIAQLVVTTTSIREAKSPRALLTDILTANTYGLRDQPAVGISYYDQLSNEATFCVWVKAVDTIFDETACGSGTSAIGVTLATQTGQSLELQVTQPSGDSITTYTSYTNGKVTSSTIAGTVSVLYDGELQLS